MNTNKTTNSNRKSEIGRMLKQDFRMNRSIYLMLVPIIIYYLVFYYGPMYGAIIAFKNFKPALGILGSPWAGLKHFNNFFASDSFWILLKNTLRISFANIIYGFPAPIILALLLNELRNERFAKLVQNFTYMPHFISLVVICGMIKTFTRDTGIINYLLSFFGVEPVTMLNYPEYFVPIHVISGIWQEMGWSSIIYLAALTGIDQELYEAATVDGAGKLRQVWHITIPGIMPTIMIMLILKVGGILNVGFEKIILLYNDLTMGTADVISTYTYRKGLVDLNWSFSSAVGLFNSVINFIFLTGTNYISKKINGIGLW